MNRFRVLRSSRAIRMYFASCIICIRIVSPDFSCRAHNQHYSVSIHPLHLDAAWATTSAVASRSQHSGPWLRQKMPLHTIANPKCWNKIKTIYFDGALWQSPRCSFLATAMARLILFRERHVAKARAKEELCSGSVSIALLRIADDK